MLSELLFFRYAVFDKNIGGWVSCAKVGKNGNVLKPKNSLNAHLAKIVCPFDFYKTISEKHKPVLIRVETETKQGITAALPFFCNISNNCSHKVSQFMTN